MAARRTTTTTRRETKMTSRRGDAAEASGEAPSGGMTMVDGVAIVTTVILLGAFLLVDYHLGKHLGVGLFFAGK